MSAEDYAGWRVFFAVEPWGCVEDDRRSAIVPAIVSNIFRNKGVRHDPFTEADFMPQRRLMIGESGEREKAPKPRRLLQIVEAMNLSLGARPAARRPRYE
jgi:hypothetical protein